MITIERLLTLDKNNSKNELMSINIADVKETMGKPILLDILGVLLIIRKHHITDEIESYIFKALSGGLLDKKAIKQIERMLRVCIKIVRKNDIRHLLRGRCLFLSTSRNNKIIYLNTC